MKKCPTCNAEYGDGATYCEKCGSKLVKYRTCPHCGAAVEEEAVYCSKCGKAVDAVAEMSSSIEPSPTVRKVDDATIEQYKRELASYRTKRTTFLILGSIFLTVGLALTIVFMYLYINNVYSGGDPDNFISKAYLYLFLAVVFELMTDAGIALLIVQGAVFGKKISNRIRAIQEYESRH